MAKWLFHSFGRTMLGKKEQGSRPSSYPPTNWLFKKATRTFNFLRTFLLVKIHVTYESKTVQNRDETFLLTVNRYKII